MYLFCPCRKYSRFLWGPLFVIYLFFNKKVFLPEELSQKKIRARIWLVFIKPMFSGLFWPFLVNCQIWDIITIVFFTSRAFVWYVHLSPNQNRSGFMLSWISVLFICTVLGACVCTCNGMKFFWQQAKPAVLFDLRKMRNSVAMGPSQL